MIAGCIFDLDGTLLDTLTSLANCFNRTLDTFDLPLHPVDDYRYFIGDGLRKCVERCLPPELRDETFINQFTAGQQADYTENWHRDAVPYPGIPELLSSLEELQMPLAVLSNKDHPFTARCVDHFFGTTHFHVVQGHQPGIPHKPDPTGARLIANQLGIEAGSLAFLGDTATDINTANAAGMISIGALWGFREYDELHNAGATHIISSPLDALSILQGNQQ